MLGLGVGRRARGRVYGWGGRVLRVRRILVVSHLYRGVELDSWCWGSNVLQLSLSWSHVLWTSLWCSHVRVAQLPCSLLQLLCQQLVVFPVRHRKKKIQKIWILFDEIGDGVGQSGQAWETENELDMTTSDADDALPCANCMGMAQTPIDTLALVRAGNDL